MRRYLYDNHIGGIFISDAELTVEECYCKQCGDSDQLLGTFETLSDFWNVIKTHCSINGSEGYYCLQYIFPIMCDEFNLDIDVPYDNYVDKADGFCSLSDDQIVDMINNML